MYIYKHELYIFENKLNSNLLLSIGFFRVYTPTRSTQHTQKPLNIRFRAIFSILFSIFNPPKINEIKQTRQKRNASVNTPTLSNPAHHHGH